MGASRGGLQYEVAINTFMWANETRCIPETTCPYLLWSDDQRSPLLYRYVSTVAFRRVDELPVPPDLPNYLTPVSVRAYIDPCDQPMDETLLTMAVLCLVLFALLPIQMKDNLRKYRQFSKNRYMGDVAPETALVRYSRRVIQAITTVGFALVAGMVILQVMQSVTCVRCVVERCSRAVLTQLAERVRAATVLQQLRRTGGHRAVHGRSAAHANAQPFQRPGPQVQLLWLVHRMRPHDGAGGMRWRSRGAAWCLMRGAHVGCSAAPARHNGLAHEHGGLHCPGPALLGSRAGL